MPCDVYQEFTLLKPERNRKGLMLAASRWNRPRGIRICTRDGVQVSDSLKVFEATEVRVRSCRGQVPDAASAGRMNFPGPVEVGTGKAQIEATASGLRWP